MNLMMRGSQIAQQNAYYMDACIVYGNAVKEPLSNKHSDSFTAFFFISQEIASYDIKPSKWMRWLRHTDNCQDTKNFPFYEKGDETYD